MKLLSLLFIFSIIFSTMNMVGAYDANGNDMWELQPVPVNMTSIRSEWRNAAYNSTTNWSNAGSNFNFVNQTGSGIYVIFSEAWSMNPGVLAQEYRTIGAYNYTTEKYNKTSSLIEDTGSSKDIGSEHYVILTPSGKLHYEENAETIINGYNERYDQKFLTSYI